jgi:hypothetical protein
MSNKFCSVCNKEIMTRYTMMDLNNNSYCCQECFLKVILK